MTTMTETKPAPIQLTRIRFNWSESGHIPEGGQEVTSIREADLILSRIRTTAPEGGAYDKTDITIFYEDPDGSGESSYHGRWDVKADGTDASIMGHFQTIVEVARTERGQQLRREYPGAAAIQDVASMFVERGFVTATPLDPRKVLAELSDAEVKVLAGILTYASQHGNFRKDMGIVATDFARRMLGTAEFQRMRLQFINGTKGGA